MKKIILIILAISICLNLVSAGGCTKSGYEYCWEYGYTHGDAYAHAKVYWQFEDDNGYLNPWTTDYAVGGLYIKSGYESLSSDSGEINGYGFYNYDKWGSEETGEGIWGKFSCNEYGCSISSRDYDFIPSKYGNKIKVANIGKTFTDCVALAAKDWRVDYNWAAAGTGYGLGPGSNCFNIEVVECELNSDCSSGKICDDYQCVDASYTFEFGRFEPPGIRFFPLAKLLLDSESLEEHAKNLYNAPIIETTTINLEDYPVGYEVVRVKVEGPFSAGDSISFRWYYEDELIALATLDEIESAGIWGWGCAIGHTGGFEIDPSNPLGHEIKDPGNYKVIITKGAMILKTIEFEVVSTPTLEGDINNDGCVDIIDLAMIGLAYRSVEGDPHYDVRADLNYDGKIGIIDLIILGRNYRRCV